MDQLMLQTPSRSYADYLQEAAKDSDDESLNVAISPSANDKENANHGNDSSDEPLAGVVISNAMNSSPTILSSPLRTEYRSFLNGLLSPFSPLLKQSDMRGEYLQYVSLQPCRKVTCVVQVLPLGENEDEQRCLFPQVKRADKTLPQNVVIVNPSAFGKHIPSHVTLETARLVSRATDTSDWARLYNIHHVVWPTADSLESSAPRSEQSSIDSLSRAIAQDAMVELQSSVVISLGKQFSVGGNEDSLWARILNHCQGLMEEKMICTISLVEILDERDRGDSFRDLLREDNDDSRGSIGIRHVDMKGAIFENLTQVPIDVMPGMFEAILRRREQSSTVIGTISLWNNAISHELEKSPDSQITCVELRDKGGEKNIRRKGIVSLGRALRQLLLHASVGTEPMISWRESTLTHVLQRRLECSKIVVMGSVSQLAKDYDHTLGTLNYLRRLLVKPGDTVSSPFRNSDAFQEHRTSDENFHGADDRKPSNHLQEYARSPQLLEQIVADPRQRLAKLFKSPSPIQGFPEINYAPSEDDYQPVDYMDYDDTNGINNETTPDSTKNRSIDEKKLDLTNPARQAGGLYRLRESLSSSPANVEHTTNSFLDPLSSQEISGHYTEASEPGPTDQPTSGIKLDSQENIQVNPLFVMRPEIGAHTPDRSMVHSEGAGDKIGYEEGMVHDSTPPRDYSIDFSAPEELAGDPKVLAMQNESQEQTSQTEGHSLHDFLSSQRSEMVDNLALSYDEYEYAAALEESSASTLGSGVRYQTMIMGSDIPGVENTIMSDTIDSRTDPDTDNWQQDSREIDTSTMHEVNVGMLQNEAASLHGHYVLDHKSHEEGLQRLQYQLQEALDSKKRAEKIAEEATSSQADLEQKLLESRNELSKTAGDADLLRRERDDLLKEKEDFRRVEQMTEEVISSQGDLEKKLLESRNELSEALGNADLLRRERDDLLKEKEDFRRVEKIAEEAISVRADLEKELLESRNELSKALGNADLLQRERDDLLKEKEEIGRVEKIAEEAISSQADLEKELLESRNELSKALGNADLLQRERDDLLKEKEEFRQIFESMSRTTRASENDRRLHESQRLELQYTIGEMKGERDHLKQSLRDTEKLIGDLKNENQQINSELDELRKEKLGLMVELQEKDRELHPAKKQIETLMSALEDFEKEKLKIKQLYKHKENEVNVLKKESQKMMIECKELNANLRNRDKTARKLQDTLNLVKNSQEKQQSGMRELELERDRLYEKMISDDKELSTLRENLLQMNSSSQQMKEEHDRYEKQHRADQTTISALQQELSSERAKSSFAERRRDELLVELHGIRKATSEAETENANRDRHNLELLKSLEDSNKDANRNMMSLKNENQALRNRLGQCNLEGTRDRLSRGSPLPNGFEESGINLEQILAEDNDRMKKDMARFRLKANRDLGRVRERHEKVVRESEELHVKFMRLEQHVVLLEKENAKLRYHRKKCLDEMRNGRDKIAVIGEEEAKPQSKISVLRTQNSKSSYNILRLVPELYLTKSTPEFSGQV